MHLKTLFSTPARAWPLWVLGLWGHFTFAPRWLVPFYIGRDLGLYDQEDVPVVALAPAAYIGITLITAPFWIWFLRAHLRDYPGHVPLWIWLTDQPWISGLYTGVCALACWWSISRGLHSIEIGLQVMSIFYFGCTAMWVSLRAVMLGKLRVLGEEYDAERR